MDCPFNGETATTWDNTSEFNHASGGNAYTINMPL
jgi:hypothetical protein